MSIVRDIHETNRYYWLWISLLAWLVILTIIFEVEILFPQITQVAHATKGLVQPTLLWSLLLFIIVIGGGIRLGSNLRARDIGLSMSQIPTGLIVTLGVWVTLQVILLFIALIGKESSVSLSTAFETEQWTTTLGLLTAQVLGNALAEESMFRGFLMPQLYLKFGGRRDKIFWYPMLWAILASQLGFSLIHIPNLYHQEIPGVEIVGALAIIFALGVFLALLYIRTANLFVCVGLHTLLNTPTPLVHPVVQPQLDVLQLIVLVLALLVLVLWPLLKKNPII